MNRLRLEAVRSPGWALGACIAVPLIIGQLVSTLVFAFDPTAANGISPADVGLPAWWFALIFTVIYTGMGIAFWQVVRYPAALALPASVLLGAIAVGYVQTLLFWAARGLPAILVADLNAALISGSVTVLVFRFCRRAAWWLLPWLVWMIATTVLKILVIAGG